MNILNQKRSKSNLKDLLNKIGDSFIEVFGLVIMFVVYSPMLPFILFMTSALGGLSELIYTKLLGNPYVWYGSAIIFGICFKIWRDNYLKQKEEEKEREREEYNQNVTNFAISVANDEIERQRMIEHIEAVESRKKKADELYYSAKEIEEHLKTSFLYVKWRNRKIIENIH